MKSRFTVLLLNLLVLLGLVFSFPVDSFALPPNFQNTAIWNGLLYPTAIRFAPNGKIFIAEKSGLIKVFDSLTDTTPTIFADLRTQVQDYGDRGLLGLAIDPQFPARPFVYVLYTVDAPPGSNPPFYNDNCANPDNCPVKSRLSKLTAVGDAMTSEQILMEDGWCQIENSHSVGTLAFGTDGALYLSHGDGASFNYVDFGQDGGCSDPVNEGGALRSQDLRTLTDPVTYNGALLRVNPDTGAAFTGNPLAGGANSDDDRMIAYGFRNPYRFSVDQQTGALWIADVGWNEWEEVDYVPNPTAAPINNFGWPCYEGPVRQSGYDAANLPICENLYTAGIAKSPYYTYAHNGSSRAISAISLYRGSNFPSEYNGALFIGDYTQEWIRVIMPGANGLPDINGPIVDFVTGAFPVDIQVGPDGSLYYIDIALGEVHQVKYFSSNTPPVASFTASADSGALPLTVTFNGSASSDPDNGDTIQYAWDLDGDGAFDDSAAVTPSFTYTTPQNLLVRLRVTDSHGATHIASTSIFAGNRAPVVTINTPTVSKLFSVGEMLSFSGSATDPDVGVLPASALKWDTVLLHCALNNPNECHEHSIQTFNGVYNGSILTPDHEYPSRIVFRLTATDPASPALTRTASVTLEPLTTTWTFNSQPSGLQLAVYGASAATPFTRTVIVNAQSTVSAPLIQQSGLNSYQFASWSDSGQQTHTVTATAAPQTFTALYTPVSTQTIWNSWDMIVQNASPQATIVSNTNRTAFIEFYESTNDFGVAKGALFNHFLTGPHQDSGNNVESFWSNSAAAAPYPYAGKSLVQRGDDVGEGNAQAPLGVRDLQLFVPNNNHNTVAAFRIPQNGNYTISNLAARKVISQGDPVRLHVYDNHGTELTVLSADTSQDWVSAASPLTVNNAEAGQYIYFAVERNGTSAGDAMEISWSIAATFTASPPAPTCTLTPTPAAIPPGNNVTLSWVTNDATSLALDHGIGSQAFIVTGSMVQTPSATTTYTATATGAGGTAQCLATVTVDAAAPTCSLTISPTTISQGSSATLTWTSAGAVSGSIDQGVGPLTAATGSVTISPTASTIYNGSAVGTTGLTTACSAGITVAPAAVSCTLAASPASITSGSSSNLSWTSQNATSITINQGIGSVTPVASGSRSVSPTATTTYTATATGPSGTNTCSQVITVTPPLPTCTLNASPTTITAGGASTLSWTSANATAISINQGIGSVTPVASGSRSVSPTVTTTYTATVTGPGGTATCTRAITVTPANPIPTCTLNASPTTITAGGASTLSWTSANATAISINQGIGSVTPVASGSRSVSPTVTTTYTATVTGPGGTGTCTRAITVNPVTPMPTCTLNATPTSIAQGSSTNLSWTSANATAISINQGVGSVTPVASGSRSVSPTVTTTYTATATGAGGTGTCTRTVTVTPPAVNCSLSLVPNTITRGNSATLSWTSQNAVSGSITPGVGALTAVSGSVSVAPTATTTYVGTANGSGGTTTTCTATLTVNP